MGFKTDREFLRNISIGAIGTRKVAEILRAGGFHVIELERYSQSNKIWATKIKRLRVPDLLCLRSGTRIESRAKSVLKISMSHSPANPERAWDKGLRDQDLVAFIRCFAVDDGWIASDRVNLFRVADMRATFGATVQSRMKAASEGSEIHITWPASVPKRLGTVLEVTTDRIAATMETGRRQSYSLLAKGKSVRLQAHVAAGDEFEAEQQVIASVMPALVDQRLRPCPQYDFLSDLGAPDRETVYAATKALGYLPQFRNRSLEPLSAIMESNADALLRLEAAAALARIGAEEGWKHLASAASTASDIAVRMESVLILGEFRQNDRATGILSDVAHAGANPSEVRAAGAWGLAQTAAELPATLVTLMADDDENTAAHSIVAASELITAGSIDAVLARLGDDERISAGLVKAVLASTSDPVPATLSAIGSATGTRRRWLAYLLACLGRGRCEEPVQTHAPELLSDLNFFWQYHNENWTNRLDVADQMDFLREQLPR